MSSASNVHQYISYNKHRKLLLLEMVQMKQTKSKRKALKHFNLNKNVGKSSLSSNEEKYNRAKHYTETLE